MPTQAETKAVKDFLFENSDHLDVALAVYETWPSIVDDVCKRFLEKLCKHIRESDWFQQSCSCSDTRVCFEYRERSPRTGSVWLYRESWPKLTLAAHAKEVSPRNRIAVVLGHDSQGPNNWYVGVCTPVKRSDLDESGVCYQQGMQDRLNEKLGKSDGATDWWCPWWRRVDDDIRNWDCLVPELHQECSVSTQGRISRKLVQAFVKIAATAVPVINNVELKREAIH